MDRARKTLTAIRENPVYTIGFILSVALLIFGLYSVGPWYIGGPTTPLGQVFEADLVRSLVSILYIIPSVGVIIGATKRSWRRWSTFCTSLAYIFLALLRLTTIGVVPFIWLFILACGLVMGVVYLWVSMKQDEQDKVDEDGLL